MFMAHFCAIPVYKKGQINILLFVDDMVVSHHRRVFSRLWEVNKELMWKAWETIQLPKGLIRSVEKSIIVIDK